MRNTTHKKNNILFSLKDIELEEGFRLSIKNAEELFEEATLLKNAERFSRAYTLFQLSIEETGKGLILFSSISDYYQGVEITNLYLEEKGFFKHNPKTLKSIILEIILLSTIDGKISTLLKYEAMVDFMKVEETDRYKNASLYVSIEDEKFKTPSDIITKEMVEKKKFKALMRIHAIKGFFLPLSKIKELTELMNQAINTTEKLEAMEKSVAEKFLDIDIDLLKNAFEYRAKNKVSLTFSNETKT